MLMENDVMTAPSLEETTIEKAFANINDEIILSEKARTEIAKIMAANNIPATYGLRVGVKGGGCSGLSYSLGFDKEAHEHGGVFLCAGLGRGDHHTLGLLQRG